MVVGSWRLATQGHGLLGDPGAHKEALGSIACSSAASASTSVGWAGASVGWAGASSMESSFSLREDRLLLRRERLVILAATSLAISAGSVAPKTPPMQLTRGGLLAATVCA